MKVVYSSLRNSVTAWVPGQASNSGIAGDEGGGEGGREEFQLRRKCGEHLRSWVPSCKHNIRKTKSSATFVSFAYS